MCALPLTPLHEGQIVTAIPVRLQNTQDTHQFQNGYRSTSGFFSNGLPPPVPVTSPPQTSNVGTDRTDFVGTPSVPPSQRTITAFSRRKSESIVPHPEAVPTHDLSQSRPPYYNPTNGFSKPPFLNPPSSENSFEPPAYAPPPIPSTESLGGPRKNSTSIEGKVTNTHGFLETTSTRKSDQNPSPATKETSGRGQSGLYLKCNLKLPNEEDLIVDNNQPAKAKPQNLLNVSSTTGQQKVSDWRKNLTNNSASNGNFNNSFSINRNFQSPMARRTFESSRSAFEPTQQYLSTSSSNEIGQANRQPQSVNPFQRNSDSDVLVGSSVQDPRKFGYNSFDRASSSIDTNSIDSDRISLVSSNGHAGSEDLSIDHEELYEDRSSGINSRAGSDLTKSDPDIPTSDYLTDDLEDTNDHDLSICSDLTDNTNESLSDLGGKDSLLDYGK